MKTAPRDGNCMLHDICCSPLLKNACKNHHVLKHCAVSDASMLCKLISDDYQFSPEHSLHHELLKARSPWVIEGKWYENVESIINHIRVKEVG